MPAAATSRPEEGAASVTTADGVAWAARLIYVLTCVAGLLSLMSQLRGAGRVFPSSLALALALQLLVALVGFRLFRRLRPIHPPPRGPALAAVVWGAAAATGFAVPANSALRDLWGKATDIEFASLWAAALTAPLNEELLKLAGVALLALAATRAFYGPIDGLVLGALAGLGFQAMENVIYGMNAVLRSGATAPASAITVSFVARVGLTALGSHWTMTAVAGAGIGFLVTAGRRGTAPAVLLLLLALAMHGFFDSPLLAFPGGLMIKVAIDFLAVALLYVLLRRAYRAHARRVLGERVAAGALTKEEAGALLGRNARRRARWRLLHARDRERLAARQRHHLTLINRPPAPPDRELADRPSRWAP